MKHVMVAGFLLLAAGMAGVVHASDPVDVTPRGSQIFIGVDEAKLFRFDQTITRVDISRAGLIQADARSQTTISMVGLAAGRTPIAVYGEGGRLIFSGTVIVAQEPGHLVRIYRQPSKEEQTAASRSDGRTDAADDYWCTEVRCSSRLPPSAAR